MKNLIQPLGLAVFFYLILTACSQARPVPMSVSGIPEFIEVSLPEHAKDVYVQKVRFDGSTTVRVRFTIDRQYQAELDAFTSAILKICCNDEAMSDDRFEDDSMAMPKGLPWWQMASARKFQYIAETSPYGKAYSMFLDQESPDEVIVYLEVWEP
jgi:hypothetical protein